MKQLPALRSAAVSTIALVVALVGVADNPRSERAFAASTITITSCSDGVWKPANTLYVLGANLTAPSGRPCLSPTVSGSTIEGNGKTITTDGSPAIVIDNQNNITVKNLITNGGISITGDGADNNSLNLISSSGTIAIANGDYNSISNSTIAGITITGTEHDAAYRTTIANNIIEGSDVHTLDIVGTPSATCPRGDHIILNNTIINHRTDPGSFAAAVRISCTTNNLVSENIVRSTAAVQGLVIANGAHSGQFNNNTFWSNSGESLAIAPDDTGSVASVSNMFNENMFRSDSSRSFSLEGIGTGTSFTGNIFWSNGTSDGGLLSGGNGTTFDHNTFVQDTDNVTALRLSYGAASQSDNFTNNIIDYSGPRALQLDTFSFDRLHSDYNLFHNRAGSVTIGTYGSLASWRTASSSAGRPEDANSIEADPLFTDRENGNFSIQSGSPTRGRGTNASDIGALPYGSTRTVTGCIEVWTCLAWGVCTGGQQTRSCTDDNRCGTTVNRPLTSRSCGQQDITAPSAIRTIIAR